MRFLFLVLCGLLFGFLCKPAEAVVSTLVADTKSGLVLASRNADRVQYPASLTKVMTLYLTFEALEEGILQWDDPLPVSEHASRQPKSKLYLKAGDTITVQEAVMALIIKSANDAAVVLSEALAPNEETFAALMTDTAEQLGLKNTTFKNASGLHHPDQVTTASDMAVLTIALINHYPTYYPLFKKSSFTYKGKKYNSHNMVTRYYKGAEGLKTGFVSAVGYNIISTAKRDNQRLVSVVIGQNSTIRRDRQVIRLLDKGFAKIKKQKELSVKANKKEEESALSRTAQIVKPDLDTFLSVARSQMVQTKQVASSYLANQQKGVLGVAFLDINDFTTVEEGDASPGWGVQIGAFYSQKSAEQAAQKALRILGGTDKTIKTTESYPFFRSRIYGFETQKEADTACQKLRGYKIQCLPLTPIS